MSEDKFKFSQMLGALKMAKVYMPKNIAEMGRKYWRLNFKKQQNPDGVRWAPKKHPNGKRIGVNTGYMESKMSDTILTYDYQKIVWEIKDVPYAKYFQEGTDNMPARGIIEDGKEIRGKIKGEIKREFDKIMHKR